MTTQAEFFQAHAVDGVLTDAQMGQMLRLPEGDSGAQPQSGTPDPAPAPTPAPVAPPAEPDPATLTAENAVILAKDGKHTIGYEKLTEAREAEKAAKQEADSLRQQLAAAQAVQPSPAPAADPVATPPAVDPARFGDFSDEALAKGIEELVQERVAAMVDAKVAEKMAPLERRTLEDATSAHFTTLYTAHPNMDAMLESKELESWIASKPSYEQAAVRAVLEQGETGQVVELFDSFVKATGKTPPKTEPTAPAEDPAKKAAAAIASAADRPPSSLSEIPGSGANHDEAAAMLEMTPMALMRKFEGKSPEQIHAALSKAV